MEKGSSEYLKSDGKSVFFCLQKISNIANYELLKKSYVRFVEDDIFALV